MTFFQGQINPFLYKEHQIYLNRHMKQFSISYCLNQTKKVQFLAIPSSLFCCITSKKALHNFQLVHLSDKICSQYNKIVDKILVMQELDEEKLNYYY